MARWKSNLLGLVSQKQQRDHRIYTKQDIIDATGLARGTIDLYMAGKLSRVEPGPVLKLCEWLGCEQADLIEAIEEDEEDRTPTHLLAAS